MATPANMLERIELMIGDTQGVKWDLSPNDRDALLHVLSRARRADEIEAQISPLVETWRDLDEKTDLGSFDPEVKRALLHVAAMAIHLFPKAEG